MVRTADIDAIFLAVSDGTRRAILQRLAQGDARVTDLAKPFRISLNSISKHIRTLERTQLISRRHIGREHWLTLNPAALAPAAAWIASQRADWTSRLDAMERRLQDEDARTHSNPPALPPPTR